LPWILAAAALAALVWTSAAFLNSHRRMVALQRVEAHGVVPAQARTPSAPAARLLRRHRWIALVVAVAAALVLAAAFAWPTWLALAFGFVLGSVAWILEEFWAARREIRIEEQLADTIDMVVSALRAGSSLVDALGVGAEEARRPLRNALEESVQRLRLGDDPDAVFADFGERVGTETAQVLAFCLTVHWRVGGSLAPALGSVSTSARHRIEFARRVRSQATEGRMSLIGMLAITYLLSILLWRSYPERFEGFFTSEIGIGLTATVVFLQGLGLMWTAAVTRIRH
jgi:tight adherence protein B